MNTLRSFYLEKRVELAKQLDLRSLQDVPNLEKVILNRGMGEYSENHAVLNETLDEFAKLTGQRPVIRKSKKAISNFKLRLDQPIGCMVTLRSARMYDFLAKFLYLSLPKIRDFRGISRTSFDGRGNYAIGLKEVSIFPELGFSGYDKDRGMNIVIVTSADTDDLARALLVILGFPFRK